MKWLSQHFKTPADAERHYFSVPQPAVQPRRDVEVETKNTFPVSNDNTSPGVSASTQTDITDPAEVVAESLHQLSSHNQLDEISKFFSSYVLVNFAVTVPNDFLSLAAKAMVQLKHNNCSNVLYKLAKCMGTLRRDSDDSKFPMNRMPMGLVEYIADFFMSDELRQVCLCCIYLYA